MAADTKNSRTARYIWLKWSISRTLMLIDIKMKKSVAELGHNDLLKIMSTLKKIDVNTKKNLRQKKLR